MPPAPLRVRSQMPLVPSVRSITSVANDKGDNEMIPKAVFRSPVIYLTAEETPRKPQLGERRMKAVRSVVSSEVGRIAQHYIALCVITVEVTAFYRTVYVNTSWRTFLFCGIII